MWTGEGPAALFDKRDETPQPVAIAAYMQHGRKKGDGWEPSPFYQVEMLS
jgi:hypothetical protein